MFQKELPVLVDLVPLVLKEVIHPPVCAVMPEPAPGKKQFYTYKSSYKMLDLYSL